MVDPAEAVRSWLAAECGTATGGEPVRGLRRLAGGASRETWAFDAGERRLVLRMAPEGAPRPEAMAWEASLAVAAREAGVPAPEVFEHGDGDLGAFLIMERLDGETIPRRLLRDERFATARERLPGELGRVLARIHAMPAPDGLERPDPLGSLRELYEGFGEPRPVVELAFRRLAENLPEPVPDAVVHGDFRTGNLMVDDDGLRGVLDWELAHLGDPVEDLGWLCVRAWRFGGPGAAGGFGTREELLAGYADGGGTVPDAERLRWWEVYGTLRWLLLCRLQAERHLSGAESSVELAVLGRRVCEQEYDLLLALGHPMPGPLPDVLADPAPPPPDDAPGADGLLAAVTGLLTGIDGDARTRFHARVAARAVEMARREARVGAESSARHRDRLAALGCADDAELAIAVRDGTLDEPAVIAALTDRVMDKLRVANPGHPA